MKIDEIVKAIREQQIECSNYIFMQILTEKEIEKLLLEENYFYTEKNGKILVAFYMKPLSKKNKIYRLGGFTVSNIENPSFLTKREVVKLLARLKEYVFRHNINFIGEIKDGSSVESFYIGLGAKRLSMKECLEQYPLFLELYLDSLPEDKEFLKSKIFYVRESSF